MTDIRLQKYEAMFHKMIDEENASRYWPCPHCRQNKLWTGQVTTSFLILDPSTLEWVDDQTAKVKGKCTEAGHEHWIQYLTPDAR